VKKWISAGMLFWMAVFVWSIQVEKFIPKLHAGDWWKLKIQRRDMMKNKWQKPYYLEYKVVNLKDGVYSIEIKNLQKGKIVGYLNIRAKDFRPLNTEYLRKLGGKDFFDKEEYAEGNSPVISDAGYFPHYFPVFPLVKKKILLDGMTESTALPQTKKYKSKVKTGMFSFSRDYVQKQIDSTVFTKLDVTEENLPEVVKTVSKKDLRDGYYITLSDSLLKIKIEQLWKKGYPFFLYSKSNVMKAKLVEFGTSSKGGDK
jgi:hypothetical protein